MRAPPKRRHPPPRPGMAYTGTPAVLKRFEVAAGGALGHLQLPGDLRCCDLLALLQEEEGGY